MKEKHSGESYFNKSPPKHLCQVQESNYTRTAFAFFLLFLQSHCSTLSSYVLFFFIDHPLSINTLPLVFTLFLLCSSTSMCERSPSPFLSLLIASIMTFSNVYKLQSMSYLIGFTCSITTDLHGKQVRQM